MALLWSVVCLLALTGLSAASSASVKPCTKWFDFVVTNGTAAPDNFEQSGAILINGAYPGPTIRAQPTDTVCVNVTNYLDHNFVIHWHGIFQRTSKNADGVGNVTQQPIPTGGWYLYRIDLNGQHGTYVYHAHQRLDILWVQGVFIIEDKQILAGYPEYYYDDEFTVMFSQCWHTNIDILLTEIPALPPASSVLMNGRSYGVWNSFREHVDEYLHPEYDRGYLVFNVKPHRTYRFRFAAITDDSGANCTIQGHNLTVIETDGTITNPVPTDHVQVNILQRYSVLVRTNQTVGNYLIQCQLMNGGPANGVVILHYEGAPDPTPLRTEQHNGTTSPVPFTEWVLDQLQPSTILKFQPLVYPIPKTYDVQYILEHEYNITANRFTVNNETFIYPPLNYLAQFEKGVNFDIYESIYSAKVGQVVQIIFQNKDIVPGFSLQHPWHIHGCAFYIVGTGSDQFNAERDEPIIEDNIRNGRVQFRDVIILFDNTTVINGTEVDPGYSGWTAVRILVNNPGVWLTHCHITPHLLIGKVILLHFSYFECEKEGYFADPSDCHYFYRCVSKGNGKFDKYGPTACAANLFFDDTIQSCNYPNQVAACRYQQQAVPTNSLW